MAISRTSAKKTYEDECAVKLPDEVFDPAYMSEYISQLDSSGISDVGTDDIEDEDNGAGEDGDEGKDEYEELSPKEKAWLNKVRRRKAEEYKIRANAAHLTPREHVRKDSVWEVRTKAFRSEKVSVLFP